MLLINRKGPNYKLQRSWLNQLLTFLILHKYLNVARFIFFHFFYSSLFLKHQYGVGYTLTLVKVKVSSYCFLFMILPCDGLIICNLWLIHCHNVSFQSAPTVSVAADIIYRHIPSAVCVSEVVNSPAYLLLLSIQLLAMM